MTDSPPHNARFFGLVIGPSGSGTTLLLRLLSHAPQAVSLGGNHFDWPVDEPWEPIHARLMTATERLWDRQADQAELVEAQGQVHQVVSDLRALPSAVSHVFFKRSAPFLAGNRYRPDLLDVAPVLGADRLILILRQPQASAVSAFRRGHQPDLRMCAAVCAEHLTLLSAQWSAWEGPRPLVVSYEGLIRQPDRWLPSLAAVCQMPLAWLQTATEALGLEADRLDAWRDTVAPHDRAMLEAFFSPRRCRQWAALESAATPA